MIRTSRLQLATRVSIARNGTIILVIMKTRCLYPFNLHILYSQCHKNKFKHINGNVVDNKPTVA